MRAYLPTNSLDAYGASTFGALLTLKESNAYNREQVQELQKQSNSRSLMAEAERPAMPSKSRVELVNKFIF